MSGVKVDWLKIGVLLLKADSLRFVQAMGGYPDDIDGVTVPGYVIAATASESGKPSLLIYRAEDVAQWAADVIEAAAQESEEDFPGASEAAASVFAGETPSRGDRHWEALSEFLIDCDDPPQAGADDD